MLQKNKTLRNPLQDVKLKVLSILAKAPRKNLRQGVLTTKPETP